MQEVSWRLNRTATYWPPNSSGYSSISFPFSWAAQPGTSAGTWFSFQHLLSNWSDFLSHPGYIIIWHPTASCGVTIRTQLNPSTVKVIPRYLWPDAPVITPVHFSSNSSAGSGVSMLQSRIRKNWLYSSNGKVTQNNGKAMGKKLKHLWHWYSIPGVNMAFALDNKALGVRYFLDWWNCPIILAVLFTIDVI